MRKVLFKKYIPLRFENGNQVKGTQQYEDNYNSMGWFHEWFNDNGSLLAIIELQDGIIIFVSCEHMKFLNTPDNSEL